MTWNEYYRYYLQKLQSIYSLNEAAAVTGLLFENKTGISRKNIVTNPGKALTGEQIKILDEALAQLLTHKPLQHITGEAWFYNIRFAVNENVLIPRPETEELVKWILDENDGDISLLDIGSGSGCIPVALKKNRGNANITSIDISHEALLIAKQNAVSNEADVLFMQVDLLDRAAWQQLCNYDIIVSNPPYIPMNEKEKMDLNVTGYEPHTALFVPSHSPLLFYEHIAAFAQVHLNKEGKVYVEIHEDLGTETANIFSAVFNQVEIRKDINGKDRMIKATHFR
ncbi:MAG TPA: peptide chain release factor N(5)-glutamine methyltransferase [Ferruginibacter sp.]|nr:peptide chain release factor N(5)-glutamine methyltransferase [Ferruginibacter sp.]